MTYPIKLKCSAKFREELYYCEYGRFEDAQEAREAGDIEDIKASNYECVFCDFGDRHKTVIEIRNDAELHETYYALASGTIGVRGYARQANSLLDKIRPAMLKVDAGLVERWPNQNGF